MKKKSNLKELMGYAGGHRYLTYLSLLLSAVSAVLALFPFVFLFRIIQEVIAVAPNYAEAAQVVHNGWMAVGFALFQLFPDVFLSLFEAEGEDAGDLLAIGVPALRTISYHFLFAGICVVSMSVFQALGHGVLSLIVSIVRQLVILLPAAFLLSRMGGLEVVWWAFPLAETAALMLCTLFLFRVYKKEIAPMRETK